MNVVTKSWIIVTLTIGWKKITNSRQHSEPIEFKELSRQLRHDHVGKKATHASRTKEHLRFVFVAFGFRCGRWKARYVTELFHFLKFVMNFLKGVVSICHNFRNTGQPGRINGFRSMYSSAPPVLAKRQIFLKFYQPRMGKQKPKTSIIAPKCLRKLWTVYMHEFV